MNTDITKEMKEQLDKLGFIFSEQEVASIISMVNKDGSFKCGQFAVNGKDKLALLMDFALKGEHPSLAGYNAVLHSVPPITHGMYSGIDTVQLEARMNTISWETPGRDLTTLPELYGDILTLELSGNKDAVEIAHSLQAKYWSGTGVEKYIRLSYPEEKYMKSFYFPIENNVTDISVKEAYNLLSGRGVFKFFSKPETPGIIKAHWKVIDNGKLREFPNYNFITQLRKLPILELYQPEASGILVQRLFDGAKQIVHLDLKSGVVEGFVETDPRKKTINLYNTDGQLLDITALKKDGIIKILDTDQQQSSTMEQRQVQKKPGKNKGRSI